MVWSMKFHILKRKGQATLGKAQEAQNQNKTIWPSLKSQEYKSPLIFWTSYNTSADMWQVTNIYITYNSKEQYEKWNIPF